MEDLPEEAMLTLHSEGQARWSSLGNVSEQHRQLKKKNPPFLEPPSEVLIKEVRGGPGRLTSWKLA